MAPRNNLDGEREQRKANHMKKVLRGDEATKTMSFKKRYPTLKKKAQELETLCNVSVCMVCFGRDGKLHMFPDDKPKLKDLVEGFKGLNKNAKKEMNLMDFLEEQERKHMNKNLDEKFLELSKWLEDLSESDALEFLESKLVSFKEKLGLLASHKHKTTKESLVCNFNTYGCNIVGSGLQEQNWVCEYNMCSENNSNSWSICDYNNNNLLYSFPNQQGTFQLLPEANNFIVSNCHNFAMPQLEGDVLGGVLPGEEEYFGGNLHEAVSLWAPALV